MWEKILSKITDNNLEKEVEIKSYCEKFSQIFDLKIENLNNFKKTIDTYNSNIFPEEDFLFNSFNDGDVVSIISTIYYFKELELNFVTVDNKTPEHYLDISNLSLFNAINFDSANLLSKDEYQRTLSFLFLFFIPRQPVKTLLNEFKQNTPLISNSRVTNHHFNMLLYLMQTYEIQEYNLLKNSNKNINHMLIESFLKNNNSIFFYDLNVDWKNVLPKQKMFQLFDLNMSLYNFDILMDNSIKNMFQGIEKELVYCEREYAASNLDKKLTIKSQSDTKTVLKI